MECLSPEAKKRIAGNAYDMTSMGSWMFYWLCNVSRKPVFERVNPVESVKTPHTICNLSDPGALSRHLAGSSSDTPSAAFTERVLAELEPDRSPGSQAIKDHASEDAGKEEACEGIERIHNRVPRSLEVKFKPVFRVNRKRKMIQSRPTLLDEDDYFQGSEAFKNDAGDRGKPESTVVGGSMFGKDSDDPLFRAVEAELFGAGSSSYRDKPLEGRLSRDDLEPSMLLATDTLDMDLQPDNLEFSLADGTQDSFAD